MDEYECVHSVIYFLFSYTLDWPKSADFTVVKTILASLYELCLPNCSGMSSEQVQKQQVRRGIGTGLSLS